MGSTIPAKPQKCATTMPHSLECWRYAGCLLCNSNIRYIYIFVSSSTIPAMHYNAMQYHAACSVQHVSDCGRGKIHYDNLGKLFTFEYYQPTGKIIYILILTTHGEDYLHFNIKNPQSAVHLDYICRSWRISFFIWWELKFNELFQYLVLANTKLLKVKTFLENVCA